jgi:hypothetical protein
VLQRSNIADVKGQGDKIREIFSQQIEGILKSSRENGKRVSDDGPQRDSEALITYFA